MKLTKRERWCLWNMLSFPIHRYMLVNTHERTNGYEKAQKHIEISKIICQFILICEEDDVRVLASWKLIHAHLSEILTSKMDEVIDFPYKKHLSGNDVFDYFSKKFFRVIVKNFDILEEIVKTNLGELDT